MHGLFSVATHNILHDDSHDKNVAPQHERLDSVIRGLRIANPLGFDAIHLCEVELGQDQNNGLILASYLDEYRSETVRHHGTRDGMLLAVRGPGTQPQATILDPHAAGRAALVSRFKDENIEDIDVISVHWSHNFSKPNLRWNQLLRTLELAHGGTTIIMGDFNCLRSHVPRRMLKELGFRSVTAALGGSRRAPITFPTPGYRNRTIDWYQRPLVGPGYGLDDILYTGDLELVNAGLILAESDHYGVYAVFCKTADPITHSL